MRACLRYPLLFLWIHLVGATGGSLQAQEDQAPDSVARAIDSVRSVDVQLPGSFVSQALGTTIGYYADLPQQYTDRGEERSPLLIFLHGSGQRGNGTSELSRLNRWGLPKLAHKGARFPMIVISPQLPADQKHWPVALIDEVIAAASQAYRVDSTRIYLTGLSTGAEGAWAYAIARPHIVAAIVPISGTGSPRGICVMREVAVWAFHGEQDRDEPLGHEARLVDALNACQPPPGEPARLTVYPDAGHEVRQRRLRHLRLAARAPPIARNAARDGRACPVPRGDTGRTSARNVRRPVPVPARVPALSVA